MGSLCRAMDAASNGLYRAGDVLDEILTSVNRRLPQRRIAQPYNALIKGILWIIAVALIDGVANHPPVLQILYLAPIWIAFETAGVGVAATLAGIAVPVASVFSVQPSWGIGWDLVVRGAIHFSLVTILAFHSRRYRTTHESSLRDSLTGARNRAGFESYARESIEIALAEKRQVSLAVIDCDHFKELNDLKGHAFGDQVLRMLVRSLSETLKGACIGRTGGDEFVILDSERNLQELRAGIARAHDRFTDATLVLGRRSTFTVGIARLGPDGMRYEALLEAADRDMYRGKYERHGVVSFAQVA